MKPKLLTLLALCSTILVMAQDKNLKKPRLISYNISFSDYSFPQLLKDSGTSNAFKDQNWYKPAGKSFGIGLSLWKGLTPTIDFSASLNGTFSNFPGRFVKDDSIGQAGFTPQLDALLHFRPMKEKAKVNPFLTAGVGAGYFGKQFAAYAPLGAGLQFRFNQGAYLFTQVQWRKALTNGITGDYLFYNIGFAQHTPRIKKQKEDFTVAPPAMPADKDGDGVPDEQDECADVSGAVNGCPDADGDGVADKNDQCPDIKGILNGCPDSDNDGVADKDDRCPDMKGSINGCPDSDNDGVGDDADKCKDLAGVARYDGCPVPDTDGDGVNDEEDRCPNEKGITDNKGCPEIKQEVKQKIEFAARQILFAFASDSILQKSYSPLNAVVKVLQENHELKLNIEAHADSIGRAEANMMWSEKRAKAVANYFISKGISAGRITYKGYGDTRPIASNKTGKGRALNRRVEMRVDY